MTSGRRPRGVKVDMPQGDLRAGVGCLGLPLPTMGPPAFPAPRPEQSGSEDPAGWGGAVEGVESGT